MISTEHNLDGLPDPDLDPQFYRSVPLKRLVAWIIDFALISLLVFLCAIFSLGLAFFMLPIIAMGINLLYRVFFLGTRSATPGMRLTGIEIRNGAGEQLDTSEAIWHTFLYTLFFMFLLTQVIGIIMMIAGRRGQGLHDYLLGTTAINRPIAG